MDNFCFKNSYITKKKPFLISRRNFGNKPNEIVHGICEINHIFVHLFALYIWLVVAILLCQNVIANELFPTQIQNLESIKATCKMQKEETYFLLQKTQNLFMGTDKKRQKI